MSTLLTQSGLQKPAPSAVSFGAPATLLQRKSGCGQHTLGGGTCRDCSRSRLQRSAATDHSPSGGVPPIVNQVLHSPGQSLDPGTQAFMEQRFDHDFSQVRIHTDTQAEESARAVNALAYTVGRNVVFRSGQYAPGTNEGRRLLAHELTHVVQQRGAAGAVQPQLEVGSANDPAESEADCVANQVVGTDTTAPASVGLAAPKVMATPAVLRRVAGCPALEAASPVPGEGADPTTPRPDQRGPQRVGQGRHVRLPEITRGESQIIPHVFRHFVACPCRSVPETREGVYWNPNPGNFAIAFRYCRGGVGVDVYGQLQSNLPAVVTSGADPLGTARLGVDVNVMGSVRNGRVEINVVGTNQPAGTPGTPGSVPAGTPGMGGSAKLVLQSGNVVLFFEAEYIRRVGQLAPGIDPNQYNFRLGGGSRNLQGSLQGSAGGGEYKVILGLGGTFGGRTTRPEDCRTCVCPPAKVEYCCIDFEKDRQVDVQVESHPLGEYRYFFRLDRTDITPNQAAAADSGRQMTEMAREVGSGATLETITGYASPEALERTHNQELSERRGRRMTEIVREQVGSNVQVPEGTGGGELYGRRFADPTPLAQQAITGSQFRSAEELSHFLIDSEEIPNRELSDRFVHIFTVLPEPADRLSLFGMTASDPLAPDVLAAIEDFMRHPRRGTRPWERVFQYLRVGVVRVRRRVMETVQEWRRGSTTSYSGDECGPNARQAEAATPGFGPIDDSARRPQSTTADARRECQETPTDADTRLGCDYTPPTGVRRPTVAPQVAPQPFGQIR